MDDFKKVSVNDYNWDIEYANELGKTKLRRFEKKYIRRTSRSRLKQKLNNYKEDKFE